MPIPSSSGRSGATSPIPPPIPSPTLSNSSQHSGTNGPTTPPRHQSSVDSALSDTAVAAAMASAESSKPSLTKKRAEFKNEVDRIIHSGDDVELYIVDAVKTAENSASPYIVYVIRTGNIETRRRYSDFESLRNGLVKLYPTLIIPPIPHKQSIGEYAVKQSKAKEDVAMIARRKRMLQVFLNRLAKHPILSTEYVFHKFLSADVSWSEMLRSPPLSQLPKNPLKAPVHDPLDTSSAVPYAALSNPSPTAPLRQPDQRFLDSESFTNRFASHISHNMERVNRRTVKRWSELAHDNSELGAVFNGFSLSEQGHLAAGLEKSGQAIDTTYISTTRLLQDLQQTWTEPLHEYSQFSDVIKKLLQFRHQKHAQYEQTLDTLDNKRESLEELEKNEAEAQRLQSALAAAGVPAGLGGRRTAASNGVATSPLGVSPTGGANQDLRSEPLSPGASVNGGVSPGFSSPERLDAASDDEENGATSPITPNTTHSASASPHAVHGLPQPLPPPPVSTTRKSGKGIGSGFISALSHSIHGMMDVDPEAARRSNISKTRENISHLEDAQHLAAQDLKYASSTIQADLDRFQRQKVADIRDMTIAFARIHREWAKANMEAWMAARAEITAIEPHPNAAPPREAPAAAPGPSSP
ncbi:hypothetical protein DL93DRAFT_2062389 [Clavulina sp. PMI_390]|nr:hypothetical protein DL93DRAFT_2062389 [Clavulina sp. PMI_390]